MTTALQVAATVTGDDIALEQRKTATSNDATSISLTLDTAPTEDNLLVAILGDDVNRVEEIAFPAGWVLARFRFNEPFVGLGIWYKIAASDESATVTVTLSNQASASLIVAEYSGMDTTGSLDETALGTIDQQEGSPQDCGTTERTTRARELLVAAITALEETPGISNVAFSDSFTLRDTVVPAGGARRADVAWADRIVSARDTYTTTATFSDGANTVGMLVTFKGNLSGLTVIPAPNDQSLVIYRGNVRNRAASQTVVSLRAGESGAIRWTANLAADGGQALFNFGPNGWRLPFATSFTVDISQSTVDVNISHYESG